MIFDQSTCTRDHQTAFTFQPRRLPFAPSRASCARTARSRRTATVRSPTARPACGCSRRRSPGPSNRLRRAPRTRGDARGPDLGRRRAVRLQGPAPVPRVPLDERCNPHDSKLLGPRLHARHRPSMGPDRERSRTALVRARCTRARSGLRVRSRQPDRNRRGLRLQGSRYGCGSQRSTARTSIPQTLHHVPESRAVEEHLHRP